jgi:hypothetical protein
MQKIGNIPNTRADNNGEFTDGNVAGGVPPTILPAEWFNTIQRELISVLSSAGITPDSNKFDQVSKAVSKLITDGGFLKTANNLSEIKTAGAAAVAATLENLGLTGIGIGLSSQTSISNFDFQNFVFTSGGNYLAVTTNWLNAPAGVSYPTALAISITVDYITVSGGQIGLTLVPNTAASVNFKVYKVLCVGAPGSRVFTVREEWSSANPVPISGGGTGAITASAALANLSLSNSDGSVGRLVNIQKFTSSGTYTPTAGTKFIIVKVIGGGGGGGASLNTNSTQVSMGGGAGAGGTAISKLLISSITSTVSVIIGAAGLGGTASAIATSGGGSSFGSYLSATGGGFGAAGLAATIGNSMLTFNGGGGDGSNGNIANSIGGSGSQGIVLQSGYVSGAGGSSSISAGGQPLSTTGSSSPGVGGRNGSGGSGAFSYTNSAVTNGGNGGSGVVYVWEYA